MQEIVDVCEERNSFKNQIKGRMDKKKQRLLLFEIWEISKRDNLDNPRGHSLSVLKGFRWWLGQLPDIWVRVNYEKNASNRYS